MSPLEKKWTISELECLAVICGIEEYKHYLIMRPFDLYTDHSALKSLEDKQFVSTRINRWCMKLQGYDYNIHYRKGVANQNADALSRLDHSKIATSDAELSVPETVNQSVDPLSCTLSTAHCDSDPEFNTMNSDMCPSTRGESDVLSSVDP